MAGHDLPERLGTWVDAGLIARDQADAIEAFEAERDVDEVPRWVEPVAYLGAVLVAVAIVLFGVQVWDRLVPAGRLALALVVMVVLLGTGLALRRSESPAALRAAAFSWFVGLGTVAWAVGLLVYDVLDVDEDVATLTTTGATLLAGIGLYAAARNALQQVGMGIAAAAVPFSLMAVLPVNPPWIAGMLLFSVGLVWMLLTWGGFMQPQAVGWVIGSVFALAIGLGNLEAEGAWWSGAGIVVALALVYLSTRLDLRSVLAVGVVGLLIWIPTTVISLFEDSLAVPVAILVTGIVALAVVVIGVRATRTAPGDG